MPLIMEGPHVTSTTDVGSAKLLHICDGSCKKGKKRYDQTFIDSLKSLQTENREQCHHENLLNFLRETMIHHAITLRNTDRMISRGFENHAVLSAIRVYGLRSASPPPLNSTNSEAEKNEIHSENNETTIRNPPPIKTEQHDEFDNFIDSAVSAVIDAKGLISP